MIHIGFEPNEVEMLHGILEDYLTELRIEVAHTDDRDYRKALQVKETFIKRVLHQLEKSGATEHVAS